MFLRVLKTAFAGAYLTLCACEFEGDNRGNRARAPTDSQKPSDNLPVPSYLYEVYQNVAMGAAASIELQNSRIEFPAGATNENATVRLRTLEGAPERESLAALGDPIGDVVHITVFDTERKEVLGSDLFDEPYLLKQTIATNAVDENIKYVILTNPGGEDEEISVVSREGIDVSESSLALAESRTSSIKLSLTQAIVYAVSSTQDAAGIVILSTSESIQNDAVLVDEESPEEGGAGKAGVLSVTDLDEMSFTLRWTKATDENGDLDSGNVSYLSCVSTLFTDVATEQACIDNATQSDWTPVIYEASMTNVFADTAYYANVLAKLASGKVLNFGVYSLRTLPSQKFQLGVGEYFSCYNDGDTNMFCWGQGANGQLGTGNTNDTTNYVPVLTSETWSTLATGYAHTCGINAAGKLYCWGINSYNLIGTGHSADVQTPYLLDDGEWAKVTASFQNSCAIKRDGRLYCWGRNNNGQIGDGSTVTPDGPKHVGTSLSWRQVSVSRYFTCGVTNAGELYCWGYNADGGLGDGTTTNRSVPTRVGSDSDWAQVDCGNSAACAVKDDGSLYCWGDNTNGQLGTGNSTNSLTPVRVGLDTDWVMVSTENEVSCGIKSDGTLYCWGHNFYGQLGDGTYNNRSAPGQVGSASHWSEVQVGPLHSCAMTSNRAVYCWGSNDYGFLGTGSSGNLLQPTLVEGTDG